MREPWIGTGWKMNKTRKEAEDYLHVLAQYLNKQPSKLPTVFVVPPFTVLHRVCCLAKASPVQVGAQNMHWRESGAFTGEISPAMVKDCGAALVELGHSERRAMFGETDTTVNKKVRAAIATGLKPLVCVGESSTERQSGVANETVIRQVKMALNGVARDQVENVVLAYEPVWAIGDGGLPADPAEANFMHATIRKAIEAAYDQEAAKRVTILYGGSVNSKNALGLIEMEDIDGLFVGRSAWNVDGFIALIEIVSRYMRA